MSMTRYAQVRTIHSFLKKKTQMLVFYTRNTHNTCHVHPSVFSGCNLITVNKITDILEASVLQGELLRPAAPSALLHTPISSGLLF